jgi:hypothetical protein
MPYPEILTAVQREFEGVKSKLFSGIEFRFHAFTPDGEIKAVVDPESYQKSDNDAEDDDECDCSSHSSD